MKTAIRKAVTGLLVITGLVFFLDRGMCLLSPDRGPRVRAAGLPARIWQQCGWIL